ncbi:MAG: hypothetical protein ACLPVF_19610 [Acidimicrobiales bacterium]
MALVMAGRRPAPAAAVPRVSRPAPWSAEDFIRWVIAVALGGIVVAVSWYVCAGYASFYRQIGPLDAAVAGVLLSGLGNVMWLLRGRRAVGERRRALLPDAIPDAIGDSIEAAISGPVGAVRKVSGDVGGAEPRLITEKMETGELFVSGEGLLRYHRPDCALAADRRWAGATRSEQEAAGRLPCGVCRP